ncbi:hypothetical protein VaNZ11_007376 [Volvox africanus]|uniref:Uncharacterized protein n=1 Tax=Volvox africanus TaxID=51714 RepID=A0ABQ5S350_9CHLO|nr:hypothetical protein VaNZ11_007376 [Volvox africanus]
MVSTRSGRTTSLEPTSLGRMTRSRTRKESEGIRDEDAAADFGQPEVTSPALLPANYLSSTATMSVASPPQFGGFGSPLATDITPSTLIQQTNTQGTPLQERLVKTIGKAVRTPVHQPPPMVASRPISSPSAMEVLQSAAVPLPDDPASSEPFASSEDEPAGPASPPKDLADDMPALPEARLPERRGSGRLLGAFTISSICVTALIAFFLLPCSDPELYGNMESQTYERICKSLVVINNNAADRAQHLGALFMKRVDTLRRDFPLRSPPLDAMGLTWEVVQRAHIVAWEVVHPLVDKVKQRAESLWDRAKPNFQWAYRGLIMRAAPFMGQILERVIPRNDAAPTQITPLALNDLLAILDPDHVGREDLQELWHKATSDRVAKQKAAVWLLTCNAEDDCTAAADVLSTAAVSILRLDGANFANPGAAGQVQLELTTFLTHSPDGVVLVTHPEKLHPNSLAVFSHAASESGHLQMNGQEVTTKRALFLLLAQYEADVKGVSANAEAAAKDWLMRSISALGADAERTSAIVLSFRRRVDAALPLRPAPKQGV